MQELVADNVVLKEDDFFSIKPIRVNAKDGHEGELPSPETIDSYVKSVIDLHTQQMAVQDLSAHQTVNLRTKEVLGIIKNYKLRYESYN